MRNSFIVVLLLLSAFQSNSQVDSSQYNAMRWRSIGPYRGGRTVAAAGVADQPNIFYIGVNNGGVWKTTDYGRTWFPIFDGQPTGSIGAITVAPSNANVVYVGCGEGLHRPDLSTGNGMYKSTDAGKTWTHLGLDDAQQIPKIAVDNRNPDRIFVAALGHPYGPNNERGIYRSIDGGKTFSKVFFIDENTGGDDVSIDPANPDIVYATMWEDRLGPWENGDWPGTHGGVFKSNDGGNTWKKLSNGLPANLVQAHLAVAPSSPQVVYLAVGTTERNDYGTGTGMGIYRSDDNGESWKKVTQDGRPEARIGGGDVPEIAVDPKNPDIVYSTSIVLWRSTNGGQDWTGIRGAPGGDDYQNIWINPLHPEILLVTADQGALISVNGGETFSSWYNQPTAQVYHVNTDNSYPYNIYSGQQESGSVGIASRGNDGSINFRDWHPVGAEEYGYVAADPLNSNIVYGGKVTRYNKLTGQTQDVAPEAIRSGKYRFVRTEPLLFSPVDHKTLYFAGNVIFKTTDGGTHWSVISPDLTRETWEVPASVGIYNTDVVKKMARRGVIYTVALSPKDINTIWAGTDDGLIHITRDGGKTWKNITPPSVNAWSKVSIIDAGHFDASTAYAAVNRIRCDDQQPHIYRTHDAGKSWTEIVTGLPGGSINAVREDTQVSGLLFASSETAVYVSFDDGNHWQSLRLNMPASSVRDVVIKDDDLVAGTHGRGFWILDDITNLRAIALLKSASTTLFKPQLATRVRWNMNTDTPIPQEEPAGENPPEGAIIDYYLDTDAKKVSLEISDGSGKLVRNYSSNDTAYDIPKVDIPLYWIRPQAVLSAQKGSHRFLWDMHYTPFNEPASFPMEAIFENTAPTETAPWVTPGKYTITLLVDGRKISQPLSIRMDPRIKTGITDLATQHDLSMICYKGQEACGELGHEIKAARIKLKDKIANVSGSELEKWKQLDQQLDSLENPKVANFQRLAEDFSSLQGNMQSADVAPTPRVEIAVHETETALHVLETRWGVLKRSLN